MASAKLLTILRDFVPEYHHAKFGGNRITNKEKIEGAVPPAYILPKYPSLNRVKFFVSPKLHLQFENLNAIIMLCGLEIKRLSQLLLKNKQKQDEM